MSGDFQLGIVDLAPPQLNGRAMFEPEIGLFVGAGVDAIAAVRGTGSGSMPMQLQYPEIPTFAIGPFCLSATVSLHSFLSLLSALRGRQSFGIS
jgi:hypothetical protein